MNSAPQDPVLRRCLLAGGGVMGGIGLFSLAGRFSGHPEWTTLFLGGVPMAFPTAVGVVLSAGAFLAHATGCRRIARGLGALTLALGLGTLLLYLLAEQLKWQVLMFDPKKIGTGLGFDGRLSPNAALSFALLGFNLLLMGSRRHWIRLLSVGGAALLAVGALGLSNYLASMSTLSTWWRFSGMALPTASVMVLSGALVLLFAIRRADPAEKTTAHSLPLFILACGLISVAGAVNILSNQQMLETSHLVVRAHEVRGAIDRLVAEVARMESSARGYALTGVASFRKRVEDHRAEIEQGAHRLGPLTEENPDQSLRVTRLQELAAQKIAAAREIVRMRDESGADAAQNFLAQQSQVAGSALVTLADEIRLVESRRLLRHEAAWEETRSAAILVRALAGGLALLLVLLAFALESRASAARRKAERELRELNEQLEHRVRERTAELERTVQQVTDRERSRRFLADAIPQLVWTALPDGRSESVNRRFCEFTGLEPGLADEEGWLAALHPDDREPTRRAWQNVQASGREGGGEYRMRRASDGTYRWMTWWARPELDAEDRLVRWVGTTTDTHDLKMAAELLEQKVRERTDELASALDMLRESRDQALEASRLKSEFLANMSHEIRTPMNGIIGMSELLLETKLTTDQQEMAQVVQRSAESLLTIINDILDFSKMEAGKLRIDAVEFELSPQIETTLALFGPRAAAKNLRLTTQLSPLLPRWVQGDPVRIRQVLTNLAGNAIKFTDAGEVRVLWRPADGDRLRCEVHDTGVGIPPEQQDKLFQAFVQVDGSSTRRHGGTGLGLAISRQLVELMGGEIGFTSTPGRGSVFWFELPLPPVDRQAAATGRPPPAAVTRQLHVLVVEDTEANRVVAQALLELLGHTCTLAENGTAALRLLAEAEFDAVLMDCQMPVKDGFTTTREIRAGAVPGKQRIPIIALTAYAMPEDRARCLAAGMDGYLTKPLRIDDLRQGLAAGLAPADRGTPPPASPAAAPANDALDPKQVGQLRGIPGRNRPQLLDELAELLLALAPELLQSLAQAVTRGDLETVRQLSHRLAGSCAHLGALRMRQFSLELEQTAQRGATAELPAALRRVGEEWTRVEQALKALEQ